MNRIDHIFSLLDQQGSKALMPYLTMGDPDIQTSMQLLHTAQQNGASICELGFPVSDPIADGPVIQASMTRALNQGLTVDQIFKAVAKNRSRLKIGLVAMVSYSIVHRLGPARFVRQAVDAGIDGFLFPDLPIEESSEARRIVKEAGAVLSFLIAPNTPIERAEQIACASSGFVYLLARSGLTGESTTLPEDLTQRVKRLKRVTALPVAVGFGISTPSQVHQVVDVADAAIVGSAIMRRINQAQQDSPESMVDQVGNFMGELAQGLTLSQCSS